MNNETVIGLMDSAYFVSKNELLKWINDTLQLDITYIQDLGAGSVYCQLIDAYHKHAIPMQKINWKAKFEYEFMANLKLFQNGLEKIGANRKFDVVKLSKAKYQDNLETIQWLKRYLEMTASPLQGYDPLPRRNHQSFFSHHSQKNSFIKKPSKLNVSVSQSTLNYTMKKDFLNQENPKTDKLEQIKRILATKESSDVKVYLINEVVNGSKSKGLAEIEIDKNTLSMAEEIL